jgi:serine/threonine protein kinase
VPKISDFGLAREHLSTTVYTDDAHAGTIRYMAPELLQGTVSRFTDKIDIYR